MSNITQLPTRNAHDIIRHMRTIQVEIKTVYGNRTVYPVCTQAKLLAELSGAKTLTPKAIDLIKHLGYTIEVKQQTI